MGIQGRKIEPHWNYLLAIERDVDRLSRFVEFAERNFSCFSIEIARIILAAGAEIDVVCKLLCKKINATSSADNILGYRDEIKAAFPDIPNITVALPRFGLELTPWDEWRKADRSGAIRCQVFYSQQAQSAWIEMPVPLD